MTRTAQVKWKTLVGSGLLVQRGVQEEEVDVQGAHLFCIGSFIFSEHLLSAQGRGGGSEEDRARSGGRKGTEAGSAGPRGAGGLGLSP